MDKTFKYDPLEILKRMIYIKNRAIDQINSSISLIEHKKEIEPDIHDWIIIYPPKYEEENTNFVDGALENFQEKIRYGNYKIDGLIKIVLAELFDRKIEISEGVDIDKLDLRYFTCSNRNPIKVVWKTYALSNFLNKPSLGKQVEFEGYYHVDNYKFNESLGQCDIESEVDCHRVDFHLGFRLLPKRILEEKKDKFEISYHIEGMDSGWGSKYLKKIRDKFNDHS